MEITQNDDWAGYFLAQGHPAATPLGRGMEGVVYDLGDGLVGKVWFQRTAADLRLTREFYEELAAGDIPFATPRITGIAEVSGHALTTERRLPGTPLLTLLQQGRAPLAAAHEATLAAVTGLAAAPAGPASHALPVLTETSALWAGRDTWGVALGALLQRRTAPHIELLRSRISRFDEKLARTLELLGRLPDDPHRIVHGDICPENILVDDNFRITSLIDWSFFSAAGDNAFEAAVSAGIFDMYGLGARASDDALTSRLIGDYGYPQNRMLLYRAAYAIATANAFGDDGRDGHFGWCASSLEREDIIDMLFSGSVEVS